MTERKDKKVLFCSKSTKSIAINVTSTLRTVTVEKLFQNFPRTAPFESHIQLIVKYFFC